MSSCLCGSQLIRVGSLKSRPAITIPYRKPLNGVVLQLPQLKFRSGLKVSCSLMDSSSSSSSSSSPDNSSSSSSSSSNFTKRIEQAWLISQQPTPVSCSSCNSKGEVECKWCAGTGFFIIGDNMLCEIPSRNTTCVICSGEGSARCSDCQGTGFRAKWLGRPPIYSE